ncbi:MAG TPA: ChbG/HpnK family deacetylase [Bryobacteraceae bacterium]
MIRLIVNADDFGWTRDVNDGIVHAHRHGILTATTLMAGGDAFDHAVELANATPSLDIGVHLTLLQTNSPLTGKPLPPDLPALLRAIAARRIDLDAELSAQVRKIIAAGIAPSHLDAHKHTHVLPQVASVVARIVREFGIRWVRKPFDFGLTSGLAARLMRTQHSGLQRKLVRAGALTTDYFAGFALTGFLDEPKLLRLLAELPDGTTELMVHPGFCRDQLRASPTRLKESREIELNALTSPAVAAKLNERDIRLDNFRNLPAGN